MFKVNLPHTWDETPGHCSPRLLIPLLDPTSTLLPASHPPPEAAVSTNQSPAPGHRGPMGGEPEQDHWQWCSHQLPGDRTSGLLVVKWRNIGQVEDNFSTVATDDSHEPLLLIIRCLYLLHSQVMGNYVRIKASKSAISIRGLLTKQIMKSNQS